ncbi:MAG: anaerobic ribonucleoside-triphosphate reductase activating protein [Bacilli bacterium]|jgi:anaerobic ribonucleoside-triphosphate reductase activating protein|nr:anaerobic ribonucleoside-triphosphate reductase activating protein [Bacilli bacterium]
MVININNIIYDSIVDGPGLRMVIFMQGCTHHCFNCHNPTTHELKAHNLMSINELIEMIKNNNHTKNITISGGEPFLQYPALLCLLKQLKNYHIWVYTGYTKQELINLNYDEIFNYINVLIDGRYHDELKSLNIPFIGSTNQKIHYFKK